MSPISRFLRWLRSSEENFETWIARQAKPPVHFNGIVVVDSPPTNDVVAGMTFYVVTRKGSQRWALFSCPCGCKAVVTLSLQTIHRPNWKVRSSDERRPTLRPSVWRDVGCLSHFFVNDGRIYWCSDSGTSPWDFKPRGSDNRRQQ